MITFLLEIRIMKTTKKQVESIFEIFVKAIGGTVANRYDDHGAYRLDNNPVYGGYNIERIHKENSGVTQPFGCKRHKPAEMWELLRFGLDTMYHLKDLKD